MACHAVIILLSSFCNLVVYLSTQCRGVSRLDECIALWSTKNFCMFHSFLDDEGLSYAHQQCRVSMLLVASLALADVTATA